MLVQCLEHRRHAARTNARHDAVLGQMPSKGVDEHGPLSHHQVAALVEHQYHLLFDGLHRDEPHRRTGHRLANRLGVGGVGFSALHIGLHIGRWHQPDIMPQRDQLTSPMMRRRTCLHADEASWKIGEEADYLGSPQLAPYQNGPAVADRVHLKDALREIQTNGDNLLLHLPSPRRGPTTAASSHSCARAGAVHAITSFPEQDYLGQR